MIRTLPAAAGLALLAAGPALADTLAIPLPKGATVQTIQAAYRCADGSRLAVSYYNAPPVALASLTVGGEFVVLANVLSGSGARYAGGRFIWWSKGRDGDLYDLTKGEKAPPLHCQGEAG
ncbi:MliC family protein [Ancylobacter oerskovii]|uniref:MliC family protein n=1 Tax=Ancylobacter oerskovii TaxID=459519 RepID=A0ABW4YSD0_9HYPH|nr:MliC family protein [Ancylobacter oerskovii]MBS7545273.1 MliC family protein [Ancylobacter oerskovii]